MIFDALRTIFDETKETRKSFTSHQKYQCIELPFKAILTFFLSVTYVSVNSFVQKFTFSICSLLRAPFSLYAWMALDIVLYFYDCFCSVFFVCHTEPFTRTGQEEYFSFLILYHFHDYCWQEKFTREFIMEFSKEIFHFSIKNRHKIFLKSK